MVNETELQHSLHALYGEIGDSKEIRTTVELFITIFRNILKEGDNQKYRTLKMDNPKFFEKVWRFHNGRRFLIKTGWQHHGGHLIFKDDKDVFLKDIIKVLVHNRLVAPNDDEWVASNKTEGKSQQQLRDDELRKQAISERNKELEEFLKDKKYREELAKNVKADIEADKHRRRVLHPQVTSALVKEENIKSLHSK